MLKQKIDVFFCVKFMNNITGIYKTLHQVYGRVSATLRTTKRPAGRLL
jgi:hypothetical protein